MGFGPGALLAFQCVFLLGSPASQAVSAPPACPERERVPDHLRPQNCALASALLSGLSRSAEFQRLSDRIAELNGAVFIQPGTIVQPAENRILRGALLHRMAMIGGRRALFIIVSPDRDDNTLITLAHEFQHVIEVLQSNASTDSEIDALFLRIGTSVGTTTRETGEAVLAGHRVAQELARKHAR
jgi:hypothetical protein